MIRKFNYTGRKTIPHNRLFFTVYADAAGRLSFKATLDFDTLNFPPGAEVFIEVYRGTSLMRFPCGTVEALELPDREPLPHIQPGGLPLFRVKVVQKGRIFAAADKLIPQTESGERGDHVCMLPVEFVELEQLVWRLDFSGEQPVLQLNAAIAGIREVARTTSPFFALVYPEIFRQILRSILIDGNFSHDESDAGDWQSVWIRFAESLPGGSSLPTSDIWTSVQDKEFWIESSVAAFCRKWRVKERFSSFADKESR
ncbi:MAG TPA: hypothetical protein VK445_08790 [Dissulfurispiraceae bacterium]|nr:hypothetical protein [Dissulfurispiraceae bacterium]